MMWCVEYLYFLAPDPLLGPQPWSWPPICIYLPWSPICILRPWPRMCLPALAPNLCLAVLGPNLYLLALASNLLFTSSGQDFTTTTTATCTITTTAITTATTTATSTTRDNNKRCLRGSKIHIKWPLKDIWWKSCWFCFSKFVSVMAKVSLNREAVAVKQIGVWLFLK